MARGVTTQRRPATTATTRRPPRVHRARSPRRRAKPLSLLRRQSHKARSSHGPSVLQAGEGSSRSEYQFRQARCKYDHWPSRSPSYVSFEWHKAHHDWHSRLRAFLDNCHFESTKPSNQRPEQTAHSKRRSRPSIPLSLLRALGIYRVATGKVAK